MRFLSGSGHPVYYSLESLVMAVVASNILLAVIGICLYSRKILRNTGYRILIIFLAMTMIRYLFPVDMPFSIAVTMPEGISKIIRATHFRIFERDDLIIEVSDIFISIWLAGSLILLARYLRDIVKSRKYIVTFGKNVTNAAIYREYMEQICRERKKRNNFLIMETAEVQVPMVYGVFRPYILIPRDFQIAPEKLYYVLCHEASHYFHHDLFVKFCINILSIIYWWNPFVHLFKKQSNLLLEMQVDDRVICGDKVTAAEYLDCLISVEEMLVEKRGRVEIPGSLSLFFFKGSKSELERRSELIVETGKSRRKWVNLILTVIILAIYYISYQFIFEALYRPFGIDDHKAEKNVMLYPQPNEIYAIENEDGTYSIYCEYPSFKTDFFLEKTNSVDDLVMIERIYYLEKGRYKN